MSLEERFRDNLEHQQRERIIRDQNTKIERLEREVKEMQENISTISGIAIQPADMTVHSNVFHSPNFAVEGHADQHEDGGSDEINGIIVPSQLNMPDADTVSYIGRTAIGYGVYSDWAWFSHRDLVSAGNYALIQNSSGATVLNSSTGQVIDFRINNIAIMLMDVNRLYFHSGKYINSEDEDTTFYLGRSAIGGFSTYSDFAYFSHRDLVSAGNYALIQSSSGQSVLNSSTGQSTSFRINNVAIMAVSTTGLVLASGKKLTTPLFAVTEADSFADRIKIGSSEAQIHIWHDTAGTGLDAYYFIRAQSFYQAMNIYFDGGWTIDNNTYTGVFTALGVGTTDYTSSLQIWSYTKAGVAAKYLKIIPTATGVNLLSNGDINLQPDLDTVEYIIVSTETNICHIKTAGSAVLHIEAPTIELTGNVNITGDLLFTASGGGLAFGEIYCFENPDETPIAVAGTYYKFVEFDTNGLSNNSTPDHSNDYITITKAGIYFISLSSHIESIAAGLADVIAIEVRKNGGATRFLNIHAQRKLSGGGGDLGSISCFGLADLAVNDTVEVWIANESNARNVIVAECNLSLSMIGGT